MPFALSLFSSLSTCERQKDVNSLCLVAVRARDQHVAAEGHEVEGRAGHLVVGERERATERTEDASRTDASRRREQGLSLGEVCLSPCSFVTAERGKRRPGALLWGPVRAPVEARRARAKLKRLPLSVSQERFFSLPLGRRQSCALSPLIRGGRENSSVIFFFFFFQTKWPPSLPPRPCACWARPCGGSALASTPWERLCRGGLRRRREVRGRIGEVDGRGRRCVFLELACVSWPRSPGQAAARFSFRSGEQAERRSMQKGRESERSKRSSLTDAEKGRAAM